MDTSNPIYFIIDMITQIAGRLNQAQLWGVSYLMWVLGFIIVGMIASVFWRGARG